MEVDLFIPCFIDQLYPQTGINMVRLLEKAGVTVHYNQNQTCCSQPAYNAGFWKEARDVAEKFIGDFNTQRYIVGPTSSCVGYVRNAYGEFFANSSIHNDCKSVQHHIYEFTDFLVNVLQKTDFGATLDGRATYHDACSALRECKIKEEPRQLLSKVEGLELVEMTDSDMCCGFGGTFSVKFEPISTALAEQKIDRILETGAKYVISTDWSCLMHLDGMIQKRNIELKAMHIVDVLATGLAN